MHASGCLSAVLRNTGKATAQSNPTDSAMRYCGLRLVFFVNRIYILC